MENAGVAQARRMAELWGKRADLVEQLNNLDSQIAACSKGEVLTATAITTTEVAQKNANGQRRRKRKVGRPKGSRNKSNAPAEVTEVMPATAVATAAPPEEEEEEDMTASGKRFRNRLSLKDLICAIAQQHASGITLDDLVQYCYESGYRSTSDRKGFVQNIRTNLNSLMNDGKVTKDDEKRYHVAAA